MTASNLPSAKPPFDFKSRKAWLIFLSVIAAVAILGGGDATKGKSSTATTQSTRLPSPLTPEAFKVRSASAQAAIAAHDEELIGVGMVGFYHVQCKKLSPHGLAIVEMLANAKGETAMKSIYTAINEMRELLGDELFCMSLEPAIAKFNSDLRSGRLGR